MSKKRQSKGASTPRLFDKPVKVAAPAAPNVLRARTYNLRISTLAYEKVMHWVRECELEVGGYGKVIYHKDSDTFEVTDAYLLDQVVTAASTVIDEGALGRLMYETHALPGELKWWWHSHVNMSTFWSGTDKDTIRELGEQDWCTATVFNKKAEHRSALCFVTEHPVLGKQSTTLDELPTTIGSMVSSELKAALTAELKQKVKESRYTPATSVPSWEDYHWQGDSLLPGMSHGSRAGALLTKQSTDAWGNTLDERGELFKEGFTGMGLHSEARHLAMSPVELYEVMMSADGKKYRDIEDKLTTALYAGVLK